MSFFSRDLQCCATCIYWRGARNLCTWNEEQVELDDWEHEGRCYVAGSNGLTVTLANMCCSNWKRM